jgi:hypothetical protein
LINVFGIGVDTDSFYVTVDGEGKYQFLSHHIVPDENGYINKDQTYYENVGKYNQFAFGWDAI